MTIMQDKRAAVKGAHPSRFRWEVRADAETNQTEVVAEGWADSPIEAQAAAFESIAGFDPGFALQAVFETIENCEALEATPDEAADWLHRNARSIKSN